MGSVVEMRRVLPPFVLGEGEGLAAEVEAAGFRDVQSTVASLLLRYASLEEFVVPYIEASPMATVWSGLDDQTRAAVVRDVYSALATFIELVIELGEAQRPLVFPIETQYLSARV
jgi:hypothetical protein